MKILVALTGASGMIYGERLLYELSKREDVVVDLIVSGSGRELLNMELDKSFSVICSYVDNCFDPDDLHAPPSSGSTLYDHMVIVPCSVSTLSKVAVGTADNLITRAAAVMLKEKRGLTIVPRETPLSTIHLENMARLSRDGCTVLPACPAFYGKPVSIDDLADFIVGKILDMIGLENDVYTRWS